MHTSLLLSAALFSTAARAADPDYVLSIPDVTAEAGSVVTLPVLFDNTGQDVQGWSLGVEALPPLVVQAAYDGSTTAAFNGGSGPDFGVTTVYPGEGWTAGIVISFFGAEVLPPGLGYELHLFEIVVPEDAQPGTVYPLQFVDTIGNPPVALVVVVNGQSIDPTLDHGSITVVSGNYCQSTVNSTGSAATIGYDGSTSIAANDLVLHAEPVPNQPGIFFYGPNQVQLSFGNGFRCVGGQLWRLVPVTFASGNVLSRVVDYGNLPAGGQIVAGATWNVQAWFRDPMGGGASFNLSDGLALFFVP